MNKTSKLTHIEKALLISKSFPKKKLLDYYSEKSKQYNLFNNYSTLDFENMYKLLEMDSIITEEKLSIVNKMIDDHAKNDIHIIDYFDEKYPKLLRQIDDPPFIIYAKGNLQLLNHNAIAIVGTRDASDSGKKIAFDYASYFANKDICIISGLALGIDTNAHKGALSVQNGKTIAIMAGSPKSIYPSENKDLAKQILDSNGTIISENPIGIIPQRYDFVLRDRLQSGMSQCSLIIESSPNSGSARQAEWSFKQGKSIFVLKPDKINMDTSSFYLAGGDYFVTKYGAKMLSFSEGYNYIQNFLKI